MEKKIIVDTDVLIDYLDESKFSHKKTVAILEDNDFNSR